MVGRVVGERRNKKMTEEIFFDDMVSIKLSHRMSES